MVLEQNSKVQTIKNNSIDKTFTIPENVRLIFWYGIPLLSNDNIIWHNNTLYICGATSHESSPTVSIPYVGKLKSDGKTFEDIIGTKDGEKGVVGALYSPPKDKDEEEDNIALILGLVLGLGLGLPLLVYFYLKMRR